MIELVSSIQKNTDVSWELIISDAGDDELSPEHLPKVSGRIDLYQERPRLGHVKGYNQAFWRATGKWVVWLNDDCVVQPKWASQAICFMERNRWIGLGALKYGTFGTPFLSNEYQGLPYANFGLIQRALGDVLGWFDEEACYFYGGDNSLTFKVFMADKPVVPIPGEHIIHRPFVDQHRIENEKNQPDDARRLIDKYLPYFPMMREVHSYYRDHMVVR